MEGNRDEAEKCIGIAREALETGNRERALRFLNKAQKLYPTETAKGKHGSPSGEPVGASPASFPCRASPPLETPRQSRLRDGPEASRGSFSSALVGLGLGSLPQMKRGARKKPKLLVGAFIGIGARRHSNPLNCKP